jgi:hypothetical protein
MITTGAKTHQGSKFVDIIDCLPRVTMMRRLFGRNDVTDGLVADIKNLRRWEHPDL